jgi:GntR family transcriptional regulator/MocR family aminotransferase
MRGHRPDQIRRVDPLVLDIDARRSRPLFEQIYDQIRARILAGTLVRGAALPSSRHLAADLGVSRTTVLQALDALVDEGYVVPAARSCVRVASELPDQAVMQASTASDADAMRPRLSRLARSLVALPQGTPALGPAPRAFRPGVPALDLFPIRTWSRYVDRSHTRARASLLDGGDSPGHRRLRDAIAGHVAAARGIHCAPEQVFVTTGMSQLLDEVLGLVVDPGDRVWIEDPGYLGTRRAVLRAGGVLVPVPVDDHGLDVAAAMARAPGARAVIITPSHHYPLGVTTSLARRMALLAWARRARAMVVEDDYDSEFRHRGRPIMSLAGLDRAGCVVYGGTFSKTMYPGLRIGFAIVPPSLVDAYAGARRVTGNPASMLEQDALAAFIEDGHFARHVRRMRVAYRERADAFQAALRTECAQLVAGPCEAGLQTTATIEGDVRDTDVRDAIAARGVEVAALSAYYVGRPRRQGLVFGFGCARPTALRAACREVAHALEPFALYETCTSTRTDNAR